MDPIANFLNKMRIAYKTGKESFVFPSSRLIASIAEALEKKGYLTSVSRKGKKGRMLEIGLMYEGKKPKVSGVKRVSHLSKRVYTKARELRPVRNGFGMSVLSTPKGILSDTEARAGKVGGEVLFQIW